MSAYNSAENDRGEWVPAIPLPYYLFGKKICECQCGKRYFGERRYREHYALRHALGLR